MFCNISNEKFCEVPLSIKARFAKPNAQTLIDAELEFIENLYKTKKYAVAMIYIIDTVKNYRKLYWIISVKKLISFLASSLSNYLKYFKIYVYYTPLFVMKVIIKFEMHLFLKRWSTSYA